MRGILLAGGSGTRLYPLTKSVNKQLLPIYDKPTIYYPLSNLMLMGIKEILIISTPRDLPMIEALLGDGSHLGISLRYKVQERPSGIAEAFIIGKDFIRDSSVCLILGDNIFYGHNFSEMFESAFHLKKGAQILAYRVNDPEKYGVVEFNENNQVLSLEEKPKNPKSKWAVPGLYFFDSKVTQMAEKLKPSSRGELEITDLNNEYLKLGELSVIPLGRGIAWLDTGSFDSLLSASQFVQTIEHRQGLKVACLEEIAYLKSYITDEQLLRLADEHRNSPYGQYLQNLLQNTPKSRKSTSV